LENEILEVQEDTFFSSTAQFISEASHAHDSFMFLQSLNINDGPFFPVES